MQRRQGVVQRQALRRKDAGVLFGAQALHRVYLGCAARECQNSERCHGKNE